MSTSGDAAIRNALSVFDESSYVDWLARGLTRFYLGATTSVVGGQTDIVEVKHAPVLAFDFAHPLIGRSESLLDDLENLYEKYVPDTHKLYFRRALGRLLKQCVKDARFPEPAISDLIYLIARVRAYEALEALPITLGRGKLGQEKKWLQYEALSTLKTLLPSEEAGQSLRQMVTLPNFHEGFSLDILLALVRSSPSEWLSSFRLLQPRINDLYARALEGGDGPVRDFNAAVVQFALRFSSSVPTVAIGDQISRIVVIGDRNKRYENGTWLIDSLFVGQDAPLKMQHEKVEFRMHSEMVRIPIVAKKPLRAAEIIWDTGNYRAFRRLESHFERAYLTARLNVASGDKRNSEWSDETADLLVSSNASLLQNLYGV